MKNIILLMSIIPIIMLSTACSNTEKEKWSKPERVLEDCNGTMSNSQQCQKNGNTQQMMIKIDRN